MASGSLKKLATDGMLAAKRLLLSTGKAAWVLGTTFLIVVLPVIVELDREQQALELENQQLGVLTTPGTASASPSTAAAK